MTDELIWSEKPRYLGNNIFEPHLPDGRLTFMSRNSRRGFGVRRHLLKKNRPGAKFSQKWRPSNKNLD